MATFKTKPALTMISTTKPSRKYLGEPGSPHFVPSSPLIDRQSVSLEDEAELKRVCTLVLANVQSSDDDDVGESFKYLASQIQEREKTEKHSKKASALAAPASESAKIKLLSEVNGSVDTPKQETTHQTAPTSMLSDRTNSDRTDLSTPLTSAGFTTGDAVQCSSGPKIGFFGLNRGSTSSQGSKTVDPNNPERAIAWMNSYLEKRVSKPESQGNSSAADSTRKSSQAASARRSKSQRRKHDSRSSMSQMDLNKRLPALPGQPDAERAKHITRFMKTMRKKRTEPVGVEGEISPSLTSPLPKPEDSAQPQRTNDLRPDPAISQTPSGFILQSRSEPSTPNSTFDPSPRKRIPFGNKFIGRFEWKRQKMPPVMQTV